MDLQHIADHLPGCQNHVHAVMPLGTTVADIRHMKLCRKCPLLKYAIDCLSADSIQMGAARMTVPVYILHQDLELSNVILHPSSSKLQRIKLCPKLSFFLTFLSHIFSSIWKKGAQKTFMRFLRSPSFHSFFSLTLQTGCTDSFYQIFL